MPWGVYVLATLFAISGVGLCVHHAWGDRERLAFVGTALVYGYLLEQGAILAFETYSYETGQFVLTLLDVPLLIAFAWAAFIYASVETARSLDLSGGRIPAFAALYLLHLDLAIDAVAIRVPFWTWRDGGVWFGVPISNFVGWYLIAVLFSGSYLLVSRYTESIAVRMAGTLVASVVLLLAALEAHLTFVASQGPQVEGIVFVAVLALTLAYVLTANIDPAAIAPQLTLVPFGAHAFYLGLLLWLGVHRANPLVLVVALSMIAVGGLVHVLPHLHRRLGQPASV